MFDIQRDDPFARSFILFFQTADTVMKYTDIRLYKHSHIAACLEGPVHLQQFTSGLPRRLRITGSNDGSRFNI